MAVYGTLLKSSSYFLNEFENFDDYFDENYDILNEGAMLDKIKEYWNRFVEWLKKMVKSIKDKLNRTFEKHEASKYAMFGKTVKMYDMNKAIVLFDDKTNIVTKITERCTKTLEDAYNDKYDKDYEAETEKLKAELDKFEAEYRKRVEIAKNYKPEEVEITKNNLESLVSRNKQAATKYEELRTKHNKLADQYNAQSAKLDKAIKRLSNKKDNSSLLAVKKSVKVFCTTITICIASINFGTLVASSVCLGLNSNKLRLGY